jgi:glucose-6-phosphate isomerase
LGSHHDILVANAFSQTQALMLGKTVEHAYAECIEAKLSDAEAKRLAPHKSLIGNRPSNTLLIDKVTPRYLGALVALYEHKIFAQSVIWGINPFDQWGVELGKSLADTLLPGVSGKSAIPDTDSSTSGLINHYRKHQS